MTDLHEIKNLRLLYCPFPLTGNSYDSDQRNVEAIYAMLLGDPRMRWFTHLVIIVRSWQEVPAAIDSFAIKNVLNICKFFGFPVIWGRNLWVSWPSDKLEAPMPDMLSHFYPEHYVAALATVKVEALRIGAAGTFLDAEPYGNSIQKAKLKGFDLDVADHDQIKNAIRWATSVTGPVDIIYPYGSMDPKRYTWSMVGLGRIPWGEKMYYTPNAHAKVNAKPPNGMTYEPGLWTSLVTAVSREIHHPSQMSLTPAGVRAINMDAASKRFPSIQGRQGVYVPRGDFADVVRGWNG